MSDQLIPQDRTSLLADVAEMYYLENKDQAEIARVVGVTRSMISRMLKEARVRGIVDVRIHRPLRSEHELERALIEHFGLKDAFVVALQRPDDERLMNFLGQAGARTLRRLLTPGMVVSLSWGTAVSATVNALDVENPIAGKVVQMVGALGARNTEYDGHALVSRLAEKLDSEAYYLNAPFLCPNPETVAALLDTQSVRETVAMIPHTELALLGIGSVLPEYSSYFLAGYVTPEELNGLRTAGAVGDVCGVHFDLDGGDVFTAFCERLVTVSKEVLLSIPIRLGVAGGPGKVLPILGALRGRYVNVLVTDGVTARGLLEAGGKAAPAALTPGR